MWVLFSKPGKGVSEAQEVEIPEFCCLGSSNGRIHHRQQDNYLPSWSTAFSSQGKAKTHQLLVEVLYPRKCQPISKKIGQVFPPARNCSLGKFRRLSLGGSHTHTHLVQPFCGMDRLFNQIILTYLTKVVYGATGISLMRQLKRKHMISKAN